MTYESKPQASMPDAVAAFLRERRFAVLALTSARKSPVQIVIWYALRGDGTVLMNTSAGSRKVAMLRRNPEASICVEDGMRYVTIAGRADLVDDQTATLTDARRLAVRYLGEEAGIRWAEGLGTQRRTSIVLQPRRVSTFGFEG